MRQFQHNAGKLEHDWTDLMKIINSPTLHIWTATSIIDLNTIKTWNILIFLIWNMKFQNFIDQLDTKHTNVPIDYMQYSGHQRGGQSENTCRDMWIRWLINCRTKWGLLYCDDDADFSGESSSVRLWPKTVVIWKQLKWGIHWTSFTHDNDEQTSRQQPKFW